MHTQAYVHGQWRSDGGATFAVMNPATGEHLANVTDSSDGLVAEAIAAGELAGRAWGRLPAKDRAQRLKAWHAELVRRAKDLAALMTAEQGKPLAEARGEVLYGAAFVEWYAEEARRLEGFIPEAGLPGREIQVRREPVGLAAIITPWNFPMAMIARKAAAALAAGCAVVVKPAEATPLTALAMAEAAEVAGFPAGVFQVLPVGRERAPVWGAAVTADPRVRKISFTGSTAVGRWLYERAAANIQRLSLELGGNAPFLIFDDADVTAAVLGLMAGKFRNAGQTCISPNRVLVQASVWDEVVERLRAEVQRLRVGPGTEPGVEVGPLIHAEAVAKVRAHVADALAQGAQCLVGGQAHPAGPNFWQPTLLTGLTPGMRAFREETFGPLLALSRFETEEEGIALANDTPFGLAAYAYSQGHARIHRVSRGLDAGMVAINTGSFSSELLPFGGVKTSGLGREGTRLGLDEFCEWKSITIAGL